jgi:S1-C subfamily serine protease
VYVIGHGGRAHALKARLVSRREFAGYWEYVLDEALFTAPAHPQWGGAALVDSSGHLVGIGSLLVQESVKDEEVQGNMFVPVDLLEPILDDLLKHGRAPGPPRAWLGMYTAELGEHLVVNALADGGPADQAGVHVGDVVIEVAGEKPAGLADLFRRVWSLGRGRHRGPARRIAPRPAPAHRRALGRSQRVSLEAVASVTSFRGAHVHLVIPPAASALDRSITAMRASRAATISSVCACRSCRWMSSTSRYGEYPAL